jgi:hypothetical protein
MEVDGIEDHVQWQAFLLTVLTFKFCYARGNSVANQAELLLRDLS